MSVVNERIIESIAPQIVNRTKTKAGLRTVPLLDELKNQLLLIKKRPVNGFVISDNGEPLTKKKYDVRMKNFQKTTGVNCSAHQLRHSFATVAFEKNVPVKSVQIILGHKQISTTMDIYTDFREQSLIDAEAKLNSKKDNQNK